MTPARITLSVMAWLACAIACPHDREQAQKQAADEGKTILMDSTGSDWRAWCMRLSEEVFSTLKEKYAKRKEMPAGGAEAAGIAREEWMADPFGFLAADMHTASEHLESIDTEPPVVEYHPRIEERLTKLIDLMNKTSPNGAASQSGRKPNNPANQSTLREGESGIGDMRNPEQVRREWSALTPKQREKILQSKTEGFPADLDDVLSDYFRDVAREGN